MEELNEVAQQKPHSQLIANIQKENRHLREIQQENRELKSALEDYQCALEHIMTKYRQHTHKRIYQSTIDFKVRYCLKWFFYECLNRKKAQEDDSDKYGDSYRFSRHQQTD